MNQNEAFPVGKKREETVERAKREAADFQTRGGKAMIDSGYYTWVNSSLDGPDRIDGQPFVRSFENLLPKENKNLKNYIEAVLKERQGKAIGVEFGGVGSRLFGEFTPGFFAKSVAVTLIDHRGRESELARLSEKDKKINHEVVEANIFAFTTYESLNKLLNNEKVDLIIERMGQGMEFVPVEPYTISRILQIWYNLLREKGVMFVQTPVIFNNLLEIWAAKIKKEFEKAIEIEHQIGKEDNGVRCSAFRLRKLPGAPNELPLLDPKTARKTPKADRYSLLARKTS